MLKKLFGSKTSEEQNKIDWIELTEINQLKGINTSEKTVTVFKHSTRCGISSMVLRKFENNFNIDATQIEMYLLDLIAYRNISNKIAEKYDVVHQSPQLLVIKKGKAIAYNSHSEILQLNLKSYL